jgi:hypothetical protein
MPYYVNYSDFEQGVGTPEGAKDVLVFFAGSLNMDRAPLVSVLRDSCTSCVAFTSEKKKAKAVGTTAAVQRYKEERKLMSGVRQMMHRAEFVLVPRGDTPESSRLFQSIAAQSIPLILSDDIDLPFSAYVDYHSFSLQLDEYQTALHPQCLLDTAREVRSDDALLRSLRAGLYKNRRVFEYSNAPGAIGGLLLVELQRIACAGGLVW